MRLLVNEIMKSEHKKKKKKKVKLYIDINKIDKNNSFFFVEILNIEIYDLIEVYLFLKKIEVYFKQNYFPKK